MRYFFKRYGTEIQMKQVEKILAGVLVGQTEEDNYDLFMKYCDKMQKLHGHNPKTVWRTRSDAEAEAEAEREAAAIREPPFLVRERWVARDAHAEAAPGAARVQDPTPRCPPCANCSK